VVAIPFSVRVVPAKRKIRTKRAGRWEASTFGWPRNRAPQKQWFHLPDRSLRRVREEEEKPDPRRIGLFSFSGSGQELRADLEISFPAAAVTRKRTSPGHTLSLRLPDETRRINLVREVIVYPVVEPTEQFREVLPMVTGEFETFVRGRGYDLYLIREYRPRRFRPPRGLESHGPHGASRCASSAAKMNANCASCLTTPLPESCRPQCMSERCAWPLLLGWHFHHEMSKSLRRAGIGAHRGVFTFPALPGASRAAGGDPVFSRLRASEDYNLIVTAARPPRCRRFGRQILRHFAGRRPSA